MLKRVLSNNDLHTGEQPVMTAGAISGLSQNHIKALTPEQISQFNLAQIADLTPKQIAWLNFAQILAFFNLVNRLKSAEQHVVGQKQHLLLNSNTIVLTHDQVKKITPGQIRGLTIAEVAGLTPTQISWFSFSQVLALFDLIDNVPESQSGFIANQIQAVGQHPCLCTEGMFKLTADQIKEITPQQIARFNPPQVAGLISIKDKHPNWFLVGQAEAIVSRKKLFLTRTDSKAKILRDARINMVVTRETVEELFRKTHGIILGQIFVTVLNPDEMNLLNLNLHILIKEQVDIFGKVIISDYYNPVPQEVSESNTADIANLTQDQVREAIQVSRLVTKVYNKIGGDIQAKMREMITAYLVSEEYSEVAKQDQKKAIQDIIMDKNSEIMSELNTRFAFKIEDYREIIDEFCAAKGIDQAGKFVQHVRSSSHEGKEPETSK